HLPARLDRRRRRRPGRGGLAADRPRLPHDHAATGAAATARRSGGGDVNRSEPRPSGSGGRRRGLDLFLAHEMQELIEFSEEHGFALVQLAGSAAFPHFSPVALLAPVVPFEIDALFPRLSQEYPRSGWG